MKITLIRKNQFGASNADSHTQKIETINMFARTPAIRIHTVAVHAISGCGEKSTVTVHCEVSPRAELRVAIKQIEDAVAQRSNMNLTAIYDEMRKINYNYAEFVNGGSLPHSPQLFAMHRGTADSFTPTAAPLRRFNKK